MKKILFTAFIFAGSFLFSQHLGTEVYESENYSIEKPEMWKATDNEGIVNIFPSSQIGAITISEYHDLELPKNEVKKFILALYHSSDDEAKIKTKKGKKGYSEYFYEYFEEKEKLFWITKVLQKDKNLFIVSINCEQKHWNGNYMKLFNETFESFKVKNRNKFN